MNSELTNTINSAITKMNNYGRNRIPFLFIIDFELEKPVVLPLNDLNKQDIYFSIDENPRKIFASDFAFEKHPIEYIEYKNAFDHVLKNITNGYSYLTNLTFLTRIETNLSLDEIYNYSTAKYKLKFGKEFVVFSPECFVKIENRKISSYPMKGTIDASIPNAKEIILNDEKEIAEHNTIVDLIRNDLSIVARNVVVEDYRFIQEITTNKKNLLQVSSKIVGDLPDNWIEQIGNIIFSMLPAGSISGAPKRKTVEIIYQAEKQKRGYYTGVFGFFDGEKLDSAVMIRFIEKINERMFYRSGGGITFMSKAEQEYQELIDKVYVPINRIN